MIPGKHVLRATICISFLVSQLSGFDIIDCGRRLIPYFIKFLIFLLTTTAYLKIMGSKKGKFSNVQISGCNTSQSTCTLFRGTNASVSIDFTPSEDATAVKTVIHGIIDTIPVPFPLQNPDACMNSGIKCPLKSGSTYEYKAMLPVERAYPKISLKVKWELQDENGNDIVCIIVPAKVV